MKKVLTDIILMGALVGGSPCLAGLLYESGNYAAQDNLIVNFDGILEQQVDDTLDNGDEKTVLLIERALKFIPPSEQAIVTMFYFDDMSIKDIAYITESTSAAVAQRLSRTRKKLYHVINSLQNDDR